MNLLNRAAVTGTVASAVSAVALAALARHEGVGALQPLNATSHWLHGNEAGHVRRGDAQHTGVGLLTHHASTIFWAVLFEKFLGGRPRDPLSLLGHGVAMSALAAAVDYGLTPKRLTPGWEVALSTRSMVLAYGALAIGFAAGAAVARKAKGTQARGGAA
jgi:hypothetical protein